MADYASDPYPSGAGVEDFYGTIRRKQEARTADLANPGINLTASQRARDAAHTLFSYLAPGAGVTLPTGFANLGQILASQGKTDPMRLNQQLSDISRGTQAQQTNIQELFARAGLGGSGLMPALVAAQGAAGNQQRSQAIAQENQLAEARKRGDLELMANLIINPALQGYGIERGVAVQQNALNQQQANANQAAQMQFLQALLMAGAAACWVAREVYGADNPKWMRFRKWMLKDAPDDLREFYLKHGASIADFIRDKPAWKTKIRREMDVILGD